MMLVRVPVKAVRIMAMGVVTTMGMPVMVLVAVAFVFVMAMPVVAIAGRPAVVVPAGAGWRGIGLRLGRGRRGRRGLGQGLPRRAQGQACAEQQALLHSLSSQRNIKRAEAGPWRRQCSNGVGTSCLRRRFH